MTEESKKTGGLRFSAFLPRLWSNWLTVAGTVLTTVAGLTIIMVFLVEFLGTPLPPYTATFVYLMGPAFFIAGLVALGLGLWWDAKHPKAADAGEVSERFRQAFLSLWNHKKSRRRALFFLGATLVNLAILALAGQHAVALMDTPEFCGTVCHEVMQPEYVAYQRSAHSRVNCVECHIGPGASWAVKAKIDGLRQVWGVLWDNFSRPIHAPVHTLRPARDTCEKCHWPEKFHGRRLAFYVGYGEDEENSPEVTALVLKVGGNDPNSGSFRGIHWHVSPKVKIRYQALDDKREKIGRVTWEEDGEVKKVFEKEGQTGEVHEERIMDCVDCHNRPTHIYDPSPTKAVDRAFNEGQLDRGVPFLKQAAVAVLSKTDTPREEVEGALLQALKTFYEKEHADLLPAEAVLAKSAAGLAELYRANVFPAMKIGWDTYPSHLGHLGEEQDTRGCFRCHDDEHADHAGESISKDCDLCHEMLHEDEAADDLPDSLKALLPFSAEEE